MPLFLALALQCLFPMFDSWNGVGLAVVNNEANQRNYTATVVSADGVPVVTGSFSLSPGNQLAALLPEITSGLAQRPPPGWVRLESESSSCIGYLTSTSPDKLSATEGASSISTSVLLPHVEVNTGFMELNHTETTVMVMNPAPESANVTAQLVGFDGRASGTLPMTLLPGRARIFRVSEEFGSFLPGNGVGGKTFQGYLRFNSNVGIAAWQRIDTPLSQSLLKGKGSDEIRSTTLAMIPHFAFGGTYGSILNLLNPTTSPIDLELSAVDDRGSLIGEPVKVSLAPGEGRRSPVGEFFRVAVIAIFPPPLITGYIRIRGAQGGSFQIVGNVEIFSNTAGGKNSAMLYPISDFSSNRWILPFASSAGGYFTGYAIANPNELLAVQTDVTVEVVSRSGSVIGASSISLPPAGRRALLITEGATGYLRISSSLPIHVLGSIGTRDGTTLDQLPALP